MGVLPDQSRSAITAVAVSAVAAVARKPRRSSAFEELGETVFLAFIEIRVPRSLCPLRLGYKKKLGIITFDTLNLRLLEILLHSLVFLHQLKAVLRFCISRLSLGLGYSGFLPLPIHHTTKGGVKERSIGPLVSERISGVSQFEFSRWGGHPHQAFPIY